MITPKRFSVLISTALFLSLSGCYKCYTCTTQTEFGEVSREVCGRKSAIQPLIKHLTSDSIPWTCE